MAGIHSVAVMVFSGLAAPLVSGQAAPMSMALMPGPAANPFKAQALAQLQPQSQQQDQFRQFQQYQKQQQDAQLARQKQLEQAREQENQKLWREAMQEEREEEHQEEQQAMQRQLHLRQQQQKQLQNATQSRADESPGTWGVVQEMLSAARIRMLYLLLFPTLVAVAFFFKWLHWTAIKQQWRLSLPSIPIVIAQKPVTSSAPSLVAKPEAPTAKPEAPTAPVAPAFLQPPILEKTGECTPMYLYEGTVRKYGSLEALQEVVQERVRCAAKGDGCVMFAVGKAAPTEATSCAQQ